MMISAFLATLILAPTPLVPEPIDRFIGISWSGIRLGATTDGDIKRTFGTEKGAIRPEALKVKTQEGTPFRVDALLDGRGDKAKVTAIRLGYAEPGPLLSDFFTGLPEKPQAYYFDGRIEDWQLDTVETRGIGVLSVAGRVKVALLTAPTRMDLLNAGLSMAPTEVKEYDPKFTDDDLFVGYGDIDVSLYSSKVNFRSKREIQDDVEDELRRRSRAKYLDYDRRGRAMLFARIEVRYDDKKKTLTIDAQLSVEGENALGKVSASGSESSRWTKVMDTPRIDNSRSILAVVEEARDQLERNFDAAVRRQRPPTKEEIRDQIWTQLINRATGKLPNP